MKYGADKCMVVSGSFHLPINYLTDSWWDKDFLYQPNSLELTRFTSRSPLNQRTLQLLGTNVECQFLEVDLAPKVMHEIQPQQKVVLYSRFIQVPMKCFSSNRDGTFPE